MGEIAEPDDELHGGFGCSEDDRSLEPILSDTAHAVANDAGIRMSDLHRIDLSIGLRRSERCFDDT